MRILRVHNRYQERGGEDAVFEAEVALLRRYQHEVETLVVSNDVIRASRSPLTSAKLALQTIWSQTGRALVSDAVHAFRPDIVHFDNTFPLLSPAVYGAARSSGAAVVQTLHNFRLLCPNALFFRDGHPCEECMGKLVPYPAIRHGCYRGSRAQSAVVTGMLTAHRLLHTWSRQVDAFIALTDFARTRFVQGGLPEDRLFVKPNFVADAPVSTRSERSAFLFVGRLSVEKGIPVLLESMNDHDSTIRIAGIGPLESRVRHFASRNSHLVPLGRLDSLHVRTEMGTATALIFPSAWYEGFPMVLVEAMAASLPVIASRHGSMAEIVTDGETGLLFEPGNARDLAAKIRWAAAHPVEMRRMGEQARRVYEEKYTPERNYQLLMEIYAKARASRLTTGAG